LTKEKIHLTFTILGGGGEQRKLRRKVSVCDENTTLIIRGGNRNFSAPNFPMLSPLVLLVKVRWKQCIALGSEEDKVM